MPQRMRGRCSRIKGNSPSSTRCGSTPNTPSWRPSQCPCCRLLLGRTARALSSLCASWPPGTLNSRHLGDMHKSEPATKARDRGAPSHGEDNHTLLSPPERDEGVKYSKVYLIKNEVENGRHDLHPEHSSPKQICV